MNFCYFFQYFKQLYGHLISISKLQLYFCVHLMSVSNFILFFKLYCLINITYHFNFIFMKNVNTDIYEDILIKAIKGFLFTRLTMCQNVNLFLNNYFIF